MQEKLCENATNRKNKESNILAFNNIYASGMIEIFAGKTLSVKNLIIPEACLKSICFNEIKKLANGWPEKVHK
jgi:hypothetical protein